MTGREYLSGLDGLRAFAIAVVLAYHLDESFLPGGFLGVDVFFVISGFLIIGQLADEYAETKQIRLGAFWAKRARRLLPAVLLLLACASFVLLFTSREALHAQRGDVAAALGYVSNWYQVVADRSYFEAFSRPPMLRHLWSLAVEEQFYVVIPIVMSVVLKFRRKIQIAVLFVGAAASSVLMEVLHRRWIRDARIDDPSPIYLRTDTRLSGLLLGGVLALTWGRWLRQGNITTPTLSTPKHHLRASFATDALAFASLISLSGFMVMTDIRSSELYRGGFFVVGLLTCALIIGVTAPTRRLWRRPSLHFVPAAFRPLHWLGTRSYGLYLWHWPIFTYTRPGVDLRWSPVLVHLFRVALSCLVAEASYRWIEAPIRARGWAALFTPRTRIVGAQRVPTRASAVPFVAVAAVGGMLAVGLVRAQPTTSALEAQLQANAAFLEDRAGGGDEQFPPLDPLVNEGPTRATDLPQGLNEPNDVARATVPSSATQVATTSALPSTSLVSTTVAASTVPPPTTSTVPVRLPVYRRVDVRGAAVGDSVMLGAAPGLARQFGRGLVINAQVSRTFAQGMDVARAYVRQEDSVDVLVLHLGTNGPAAPATVRAFFNELVGVPLVVVVNVHLPGPAGGFVDVFNAALVKEASGRPNFVLVDWNAAARSSPNAFYDDGTHTLPIGAQTYAGLIAEAIAWRCGKPLVSILDRTPTTTTSPPTTTSTTTTTTTIDPLDLIEDLPEKAQSFETLDDVVVRVPPAPTCTPEVLLPEVLGVR